VDLPTFEIRFFSVSCSTILILLCALLLFGLKPIITLYSGDSANLTKKFEGFVDAAFWIGAEHIEGDLESVKVRQPNESYDSDVASLLEFSTLLVRRQISFSVEFFTEPPLQDDVAPPSSTPPPASPSPPERSSWSDYMLELEKLKEDSERGLLTKKQYASRKEALLRKWRESVEGGLNE
jgi:hypothetical protein